MTQNGHIFLILQPLRIILDRQSVLGRFPMTIWHRKFAVLLLYVRQSRTVNSHRKTKNDTQIDSNTASRTIIRLGNSTLLCSIRMQSGSMASMTINTIDR